MENEDIQHLERLKSACERRLRHLELKEALEGTDTPPKILIEIEDYREKLNSINKKIQRLKSWGPDDLFSTKGNESNQALSLKHQIEITFKGNFTSVTPDLQIALIRMIAAMAEIAPEQVNIVKIVNGSVIVRVELPQDAAQKLLDLHNAKDPLLSELEVDKVASIGKPYTPSFDNLHNRKTLIDIESALNAIANGLRTNNPQLSSSDLERVVITLLNDIGRRLGDGEELAFLNRDTEGKSTLSIIGLELSG